jgi:hypothetical protein
MKVSARLAAILAAVFAVFCLGFAVSGFTSLGEITDATQLADAKGFAWFWTFLAAVALVFGALSLWITRTEKDDDGA